MITVIFKQRPGRSGGRIEIPTFFAAGILPNRLSARPHVWQPPTDVYEFEDRLLVLVEIAGMDESGFTIQLDRKTLLISGMRQEPLSERKAFHQMEIRFGEFYTAVELAAAVDVEKVEAEYRNGFLWVHLPKARPQHVTINTDPGES